MSATTLRAGLARLLRLQPPDRPLHFGVPERIHGETVIAVAEEGRRGARPLGVLTVAERGSAFHPLGRRVRAIPAMVAGLTALAGWWLLRGRGR